MACAPVVPSTTWAVIRAPLLGALMNFVLTFFAYDTMKDMLVAMFGAEGVLTSPFWLTLEGAIVGLLIGYLAIRFGGAGAETVGR